MLATDVQGTTEQTLTVSIVQSKDTELTGCWLNELQGLLRLGSTGVKPLSLSGGGTGFQISYQSRPARRARTAGRS